VTVKTVEMHLANAYRNGIGSRRQLAPLVRAAEFQGAGTG
jgi:hypothetical protein